MTENNVLRVVGHCVLLNPPPLYEYIMLCPAWRLPLLIRDATLESMAYGEKNMKTMN